MQSFLTGRRAKKRAELLARRDSRVATQCPSIPQSTAVAESIDPLASCAYHPAVELDETLSIDARGTVGKTEIE